MRIRILAAVVGLVTLLPVAAPVATGTDDSGVEVGVRDRDVVVEVWAGGGNEARGGTGAAAAGSGSAPTSCRTTIRRLDEPLGFPTRSERVPPGILFTTFCTRDDGVKYWIWDHRPDTGGPGAAPAREAAARALATMELPLPEPQFNPTAPSLPVVGVPTWLWADPDSWAPVSASASIAAVSATVVARPSALTWDPGDGGTAIVCPGGGTPYDTNRPARSQHSSCSHVFGRRGRFTSTVAIRWALSWSATDGTRGTLPPVTTRVRVGVPVRERQAVG